MKLATALAERNKIYNKVSRIIINKHQDIFDTLFKHFVPTDRTIKWQMLDFHPANPALLWVLGLCQYKINSVIHTESGEAIGITKDNAHLHATPLKLVVPTKSIDAGDLAEAITFMGEYNNLLLATSSDEMEHMVENDDFLKEMFSAFGGTPSTDIGHPEAIITPTSPSDVYDGFDLTKLKLDDAQLKQLKLLNLKGTS